MRGIKMVTLKKIINLENKLYTKIEASNVSEELRSDLFAAVKYAAASKPCPELLNHDKVPMPIVKDIDKYMKYYANYKQKLSFGIARKS
jgi:hypothetical protein